MTVMRAQVLYEYEGQDADQLTIRPGDIIEIIDDSPDLNGWALAKIGEQSVVLFIDNSQKWPIAQFEQYYSTVLMQEHTLPYCVKLSAYIHEVYIPFPCSKFMYTMTRPDLKRGAVLHLLFSFILAIVDSISMLVPCLSFNSSSTQKFVYVEFFKIQNIQIE
ncbi:hypothetical protein RFI_00572 [Reticulomyxa filosa]|uniref:SH3 domain-containing protein n=1 Tax=Reticulomyxa filosa TaxID=46433 RepID=X6PDD0_RETFI|nr:hypothetical protein RFI_00572 [Reticulomyxa filosa]|eukprot:ETO36490.1 hypothetical protein RFI_00572 [Reticulomyxa filosa]